MAFEAIRTSFGHLIRFPERFRQIFGYFIAPWEVEKRFLNFETLGLLSKHSYGLVERSGQLFKGFCMVPGQKRSKISRFFRFFGRKSG